MANKSTLLRLSTLDVIHPTVLGAEDLYNTCQTGDLLLWCVDASTTDPWAKLIQAFGGTAAEGRRCPVLHSIFVVRNPPKDVLDHYGFSLENDGEVYAFESSCLKKSGAKLTPLRDGSWLQHKISDKGIPGIVNPKLIYRKLSTPSNGEFLLFRAFWDWLIEAETIPYKVNHRDFFNMGLRSGAYKNISAAGKTILKQKKLGSNILSSMFSIMAAILIYFVLLLNFVWTFVWHWIPMTICRGSLRCQDGSLFLRSTRDKKVETLFCSSNTSMSLMKAGILSDMAAFHVYLPIDFLPNGVVGDSLMDDRLNPGFSYDDQLQQVTKG